MRVLLVKLSSMGDLVHTLPAINDALNANEDIELTWVVEEAFVDIARAHPRVTRVFAICLRRFLSRPIRNYKEFGAQLKSLREEKFDLILDAQGLLKSAILCRLIAAQKRVGYDAHSARESMASLFYTQQFAVSRDLHAVQRSRTLFARALRYALPDAVDVKFGLELPNNAIKADPYVVFLHGTTWESKLWPTYFWAQLAQYVSSAGYAIKIPWGSDEERARAEQIAESVHAGEALDRVELAELMNICANASFVVSVDTGLGHLAGALGVPVFALFGPTKTELTGILGENAHNLAVEFGCAPCLKRKCDYPGVVRIDEQAIQPACFSSLSPDYVWQQIESHITGVEEDE